MQIYEDPDEQGRTNTITFIIINDTEKDLSLIVWTQTNLAATTAHSDPPSLLVPKVPQRDCDPHMRNREDISVFLLNLANHLAEIRETFQHGKLFTVFEGWRFTQFRLTLF